MIVKMKLISKDYVTKVIEDYVLRCRSSINDYSLLDEMKAVIEHAKVFNITTCKDCKYASYECNKTFHQCPEVCGN